MAASSVCQVLRLNTSAHRALPTLSLCLSRHFHRTRDLQKGNKRFKAPPSGKDKEKWVSRAKQMKNRSLIKTFDFDERFAGRIPKDDVWIRTHYPRPRHQLESVIDMHRELAMPEMCDNMDGLLILKADLDMTTKKKTKFQVTFKNTILLPHNFDDGTKNRVVAFCRTQEDKEIAERLGAAYAGGIDLIKSFENGELRHEDDYDHVVCTTEMLPEVIQIRKILKDNLPEKKRGSVGDDLDNLVETFVYGKTYQSTKSEDSLGHIEVPIGKLNMPTGQIIENFKKYIEAICSHRSPDLGPFLKCAFITCAPSTERFRLADEEILSVALTTKDKKRNTTPQLVGDKQIQQEARI